MDKARIALLPDRGIVSVAGEDADKLLHGILTNDIEGHKTDTALFAGLLSPQGKILFDFLAVRVAGGHLLDVAADKASELAKRLTLYKLRAKATIEVVSERYAVGAVWDAGPTATAATAIYRDPRNQALGWRFIAPQGQAPQGEPPSAYHAHRIALGVPEGGKDYDFGDAFPHEANLDLVAGVSFEKGCYVGQEIVARMQHRGTVRKRVVRVTAAADLPATRPDVVMGDVVIGKLGSVAGRMGLALLRLDRAIDAIDNGEAVTATGLALAIDADMIARQRKLMSEKAATP